MMMLLPPVTSGQPLLNVVHHCDALTLLEALPNACIDALITDTPYESTEFTWDRFGSFIRFFKEVWRVCKPDSACVMFANMQLATRLMNATDTFKYDWIWCKNNPVGRLNAHYAPMKQHELILVFSQASATPNQFSDNKIRYSPQGLQPFGKTQNGTRLRETATNTIRGLGEFYQEYTNYPRSLLYFDIPFPRLHPTQKPVELLKYLISTYTLPGQIVLDPFAGSGSLAVAAKQTDRRYICGDSSAEYVEIARKRLRDTDPYQATVLPNGAVQHSLWEGLA